LKQTPFKIKEASVYSEAGAVGRIRDVGGVKMSAGGDGVGVIFGVSVQATLKRNITA
jgi:hypothetical protein